MHVKTNAPKLNAEIHTVKAHINKVPPTVPSPSVSTGSSSSSSTSAAASPTLHANITAAAAAASAAATAAAEVTWEIVSWGKLTKSDSLLSGQVDTHTPIDISVRNIEYA